MSKKIAVVVLAIGMVIGGASMSFATRVKCTVDSVDGDKVTMTCKKADKLVPGAKVKVSVKKKAAVEGC